MEHFPVKRLEAETIRDSILKICGTLDEAQFGPAQQIEEDETGQVIATGTKQRRSVYIQVRRTKPVAMLQSFDAPVMETNCAKRQSSTVAMQSLMLMNSKFIVDVSNALADQLTGSNANTDDLINSTWKAIYCRPASDEELESSQRFITQQITLLESKKTVSPKRQAIANLVQALFSSNEFLYVD
ncbi:MAG: DUF1553 domain-containing protein [Planctomycetales bacterium]|nr:DUF1553 domain-containing protein [Planctomycetales bacterium]